MQESEEVEQGNDDQKKKGKTQLPWRDPVLGPQLRELLVQVVAYLGAHSAKRGEGKVLWQQVHDGFFEDPLANKYERITIAALQKKFNSIFKEVREKYLTEGPNKSHLEGEYDSFTKLVLDCIRQREEMDAANEAQRDPKAEVADKLLEQEIGWVHSQRLADDAAAAKKRRRVNSVSSSSSSVNSSNAFEEGMLTVLNRVAGAFETPPSGPANKKTAAKEHELLRARFQDMSMDDFLKEVGIPNESETFRELLPPIVVEFYIECCGSILTFCKCMSDCKVSTPIAGRIHVYLAKVLKDLSVEV